MEFDTLIKMRIFPILQKYGFKIVEESKNRLRFQSSVLEMNMVYNNREQSCYISIGKKEKSLYELRDNAIRELLNSSLSIEQVAPEVFIQNLAIIFEKEEGSELLKGNINDFIKFKISEDNDYTSQLLQKQILKMASMAWDSKNYIAFIEYMDKIDANNIPQSYLLRYKIAKRRSQ